MINIVKLIWAFDLEAGEKNVDDNIATGFIDGFTMAPKEFPIRFKQRSKEHEKVVREEYQAANVMLEKYEGAGGKNARNVNCYFKAWEITKIA